MPTYNLSKHTKRRLLNCLKAGILGALLAFFPAIEQGKMHVEYPLVGFIAGCVTGMFELFVYRKSLRKINFFLGLLIRSSSYTATVYLIIITAITVYFQITGSLDARDLLKTFTTKELLAILLQAFKGSLLIVFLFQLDDLLGDGVFRKYVTGIFHVPKKQDMIFMFLDLRSSTHLAEKLGDEKYYSLINDLFHDVSAPIVECDAEIYKYVGDEVIIMWPLKKGRETPTCVDLFFMIKQKIRRKKEYYLEKYGVLPEFKAGIHSGNVITALIGDIRKEIVYNGDVLNTASRLEELCNEYNADLLISQAVYNELKWTGRYDAKSLGIVQLKGKLQPIEVYTISKN